MYRSMRKARGNRETIDGQHVEKPYGSAGTHWLVCVCVWRSDILVDGRISIFMHAVDSSSHTGCVANCWSIICRMLSFCFFFFFLSHCHDAESIILLIFECVPHLLAHTYTSCSLHSFYRRRRCELVKNEIKLVGFLPFCRAKKKNDLLQPNPMTTLLSRTIRFHFRSDQCVSSHCFRRNNSQFNSNSFGICWTNEQDGWRRSDRTADV